MCLYGGGFSARSVRLSVSRRGRTAAPGDGANFSWTTQRVHKYIIMWNGPRYRQIVRGALKFKATLITDSPRSNFQRLLMDGVFPLEREKGRNRFGLIGIIGFRKDVSLAPATADPKNSSRTGCLACANVWRPRWRLDRASTHRGNSVIRWYFISSKMHWRVVQDRSHSRAG